jgi:hypothetical protein
MELTTNPFIRFLQEDLAVPTSEIRLALQQCEQTPSLLPMLLWQYGLITLAQLDRIFDWLEAHTPPVSLVAADITQNNGSRGVPFIS